jgi:hypothetical protein
MKKFLMLTLGIPGGFILLVLLGMLTGVIHFKEPVPTPEEMTEIRFNYTVSGLKEFKNMCGRYPLTEEGLDSLNKKPKNIQCQNYEKIFVRPYPDFDGWNITFRYISDGKSYRIEASHGLSKVSQ